MSSSQPPLKIAVDSGHADTPVWNAKERRQWVATLFLGSMVVFAARTIMPLCAVTVANEFGWDKTDMGLVLGCFFWGYPVFQIVGGYLSDRIGGELVMYRAAAVWSVVTIATPHIAYMYPSKQATVYSMAFLRFLLGLAQGVHYPSLTSLITSKVETGKKAVTLTTVFAAGQAGTVLTGSVGSIILHRFHWSTIFYFFGSLGLIWAIVVRIFSKHSRRKKLVTIPSSSRKDKDDLKKTGGDSYLHGFPIGILCSKAPFWGLFIAHICTGYYFFILLNWIPTYFTEVYPGHKGWVFNVAPWLVAIPSSILSGYLSGQLVKAGCAPGKARKIVFSLCSFGMVSSLVLVSFTTGYNTALVLMVIAAGSQAFANGALPVNIQDIAPKHAGAVFGVLNTVGALQGFIGSYAAGYILHYSESWATVFCSTAAIAFFGWTMFTCFASGKPIL
ncbi:voltage-gated purine nucleotide uniporter SLC17A9-like isoform X2 [Amphiura filiformis]|uniref:voltage-gated purine nucleotide uniporter SLC17A9-like isoform X2 n=1 Tax=Amphiura filiformis TaxID=82378 RepID=UPI003B20FFDA